MFNNFSDKLTKNFFLYTGKINSVALDNAASADSQKRYLDQHGVAFHRGDIDKWESYGTLKIYCPSFLVAFEQGKDYQLLNCLFSKLEPLLKKNVPLHKALNYASVKKERNWFKMTIKQWINDCLLYPDKLYSDNYTNTILSYDRSILLQDIFTANRKNAYKYEIAQAIGHLKSIYIAMAPHYSIEAHMDDTHIDNPWHLPTHTQTEIEKLTDKIAKNINIDWKLYFMGMRYNNNQCLSPDMFRFFPVLSSIIAPYVTINGQVKKYYSWDHFANNVTNTLPVDIKEVFMSFANSMKISLNQAVFAGWKMLSKDIRKRGKNFLRPTKEALRYFHQLKKLQKESLSYYYRNYGLIRDVGGKRNSNILSRLIKVMANIEFFNSYIGCYKFIPWKISDKNFQGKYLPYSIMREEKSMLYQALLSGDNSFWLPAGYWFRDILGRLLDDEPSMYAKWFIPLLEDGYIDPIVIKEANEICVSTLQKLLEIETIQK